MKLLPVIAFVAGLSGMSAAIAEPGARSLEDRAQIVDALYRFGAGQDLDDRALFESAFTESASLDFTGPAARLGASMPVMRGRRRIADLVMTTMTKLDTTHTVTNPRVTLRGNRAELFALVEAQHIPKEDPRTHLLLKNFYKVSLVRQNGKWLIDKLKIDNVWYTGEPAVLFPK